MERGPRSRVLGRLLEAVLASRAEANAVFDILAGLQVRRAGRPGLGRERRCGARSRAFPGGSPRPAAPGLESPARVESCGSMGRASRRDALGACLPRAP